MTDIKTCPIPACTGKIAFRSDGTCGFLCGDHWRAVPLGTRREFAMAYIAFRSNKCDATLSAWTDVAKKVISQAARV